MSVGDGTTLRVFLLQPHHRSDVVRLPLQSIQLPGGRSASVRRFGCEQELIDAIGLKEPEIVLVKEARAEDSCALLGTARRDFPRVETHCFRPAPRTSYAVRYARAGATTVIPSDRWHVIRFLCERVSGERGEGSVAPIITRNPRMRDLIQVDGDLSRTSQALTIRSARMFCSGSASAQANRPAVEVAHEPTANLDSRTGKGILEVMIHFNREPGATDRAKRFT
jgi:hypothetical protein